VLSVEPTCIEALLLKSRLYLKTKRTDQKSLKEIDNYLDKLEAQGYTNNVLQRSKKSFNKAICYGDSVLCSSQKQNNLAIPNLTRIETELTDVSGSTRAATQISRNGTELTK
jgi:uncharacterized protein YjcR